MCGLLDCTDGRIAFKGADPLSDCRHVPASTGQSTIFANAAAGTTNELDFTGCGSFNLATTSRSI
jgi:hypothetical protein